MKMKSFAIAGIVGVGLVAFYGLSKQTKPDNQNNTIQWKTGKKLSWDDFQGLQDSNSAYKAITSVKVEYNHNLFENHIDYYVRCLFNCDKSWSKLKSSNELLKHEQLHFDIAELISRKIRKTLSSYTSYNLNATSLFLKETNKRYYHFELDSINFAYDEETNHSIIHEKQKEWELKITKELRELDAYANPKVVIKRAKTEN
jgi:hypothetical protein